MLHVPGLPCAGKWRAAARTCPRAEPLGRRADRGRL